MNGIRAAAARGQGVASAALNYTLTKLSNTGKNRATASDLLWTFCGMFAAVSILGCLNMYVRGAPVVGVFHQHGLSLLLGSFGTLCVLIFGRPEAEAVRLWNLLAGHVIATFTVRRASRGKRPGPCVASATWIPEPCLTPAKPRLPAPPGAHAAARAGPVHLQPRAGHGAHAGGRGRRGSRGRGGRSAAQGAPLRTRRLTLPHAPHRSVRAVGSPVDRRAAALHAPARVLVPG